MAVMKSVTIELPAHFHDVAREVAESEGSSLQAWCAKALQGHLLGLAAAAEADWEREHPAERAAFYAEREAEHEAMYAQLAAEDQPRHDEGGQA
ncbi:hypothetical protein D7D52_35990 [Nocardia yunnanensis]|uniref:Uncharacterized protein n=1 Tax=Nocardia yunnanensis TaxID=2382165 RepID=A0A386ZL91_9NOCA|nr:hypothetical protein [Nocardia yunnanensis]AYF78341.1 hypothetical protein D7D52_35990 [Nocardia yunnanensis]